MSFSKLENLVKFEDDGGDKGGGTGGGTFNQGQVNEAVEAAVKKAVGDVQNLKANNQNLKNEKQAALERVKKFDGVSDGDLTELSKFKEEKAELEKKKALDAGKWKDLEVQLIEKHDVTMKEKDSRINFLMTEVTKHVTDSQLTKSLAKVGGQPHLILHALKEHVKLVENDKGIHAVVIDPLTGNERIADDKGTKMTMDQLVEDFKSKDEWAGAFAGSGQSGMDTKNNNTRKGNPTGAQMTQTQFSNLDLKQMEFARERRAKGELTIVAG